jgi:hypothetical protein
VAITVRGRVSAYVISAERMHQLEVRERAASFGVPPRLDDGSVRIVGDLEDASRQASLELEQTAVEAWRSANRRS